MVPMPDEILEEIQKIQARIAEPVKREGV
jgi:hypothetical protein